MNVRNVDVGGWESLRECVCCVFIITDKAKLVGEEAQGVGVMKDEEIKLEEIFVVYD